VLDLVGRDWTQVDQEGWRGSQDNLLSRSRSTADSWTTSAWVWNTRWWTPNWKRNTCQKSANPLGVKLPTGIVGTVCPLW